MKGKIFKNKYGKLSLRGEDGQFYLIGKSLQDKGEDSDVEFEITETTYNGKPQQWANAPKQGNDTSTAKTATTQDAKSAPQDNANSSSAGGGELMVVLIKGVAALVNEQKETNRLIGELLKKGGSGTTPVTPKTPAEQPNKNQLGALPF